MINFKSNWDDHLPLIEFSYDNSYDSTNSMALFKALYGRRCRCPILLFEIDESSLLGLEIIYEALEKVPLIRNKLKHPVVDKNPMPTIEGKTLNLK